MAIKVLYVETLKINKGESVGGLLMLTTCANIHITKIAMYVFIVAQRLEMYEAPFTPDITFTL